MLKKQRVFSQAQNGAESGLIPARQFSDAEVDAFEQILDVDMNPGLTATDDSALDDNSVEGRVDLALAKKGLHFDGTASVSNRFIPVNEKRKGRRRSVLARLALASFGILVVAETSLGLLDAWHQSAWLFSLYALLIGTISVWALTGAVKEWRTLQRLKGVEDTQAVGKRLSQSMQMGEADKFIANIIRHLPDTPAVSRYYSMTNDDHNDAEKLTLFDSLILSERDLAARKIVRRYAAESALLLAASPLAMLDMAIMLWRNQGMIRDIADCYGIELGYWSRIKLIRSIIINIIYAGTSEIVADLGTQLLSLEMTGKLSTRLAQGLGGGLLTARLGYQAMALCRPLAFSSDNRPKLTKIHQELLSELKSFASKASAKSAGSSAEIPSTVRNKDFT